MPTTRESTRLRRGRIYIPQNVTYPKWKLQLTSDDSTVYTVLDSTDSSNPPVADDCLNASVIKILTEGISRFSLTLNNDKGKFLNIFNGGETVEIFADYDDATNKVFRGKVDNVYYSLSDSGGYLCNIEGRDYPEIVDRTVIKSSTNEAIDVAIKDILSNYFSDITFTFWEGGVWKTSGYFEAFTQITQNFRHISGWQAIAAICKLGNYDCRLDYSDGNWYLRVFTENSILNTTENVMVGQNLIGISRYGLENDRIKNRITAYGKVDTNVISILTKSNTDSQSDLWIKEEIINDSSLDNSTSMNERIDAELANKATAIKKGAIQTIGLPTLQVGEKLRISAPYCGLDDVYKISELTMNFSASNGFTNTLQISKKPILLPEIIKARIDAEQALQPYENLNAQENGIFLFFDGKETILLSDCIENEDRLELASGKLEGVMTSYMIETESNVTKGELRIRANYPNTENDIYEATNDNGITWLAITPGELFNFTTTGNQVILRITLRGNSTHSPVYESCCLLVK